MNEHNRGNPCAKDCPGRSPECHAKCEKYAAFAEECAKRRAARAKELELEGIRVDSVLRMKKKGGKNTAYFRKEQYHE